MCGAEAKKGSFQPVRIGQDGGRIGKLPGTYQVVYYGSFNVTIGWHVGPR